MKYLVESIRTFEIMKGTGVKAPVGDEVANRINNRKSIVAIKDIKKGDIFTEENIDIKRPGSGMEPKRIYDILGKTAKNDIESDELLREEDF
jgi:N-acetylneuraminate synthase